MHTCTKCKQCTMHMLKPGIGEMRRIKDTNMVKGSAGFNLEIFIWGENGLATYHAWRVFCQ